MTKIHDTTLMLLARRAPDGTVCPSEVARALAVGLAEGAGGAEWRTLMPTVHAAVDQLLANGQIRLSWKGQTLRARSGPYRIGRP